MKHWGYRRLAADVVASAFADMASTEPGEIGVRVRAAAWLVSRAATVWCEIAGVDQEYLLRRRRWSEGALPVWREIRAASGAHLEKQGIEPHHIRLIMEHLGPSAVVHVA